MKKSTLFIIILATVSIVGCGSKSTGPIGVIDYTYGIAHQDAKDLLDANRDYLIIVNEDNEYNFDSVYHKALQYDLVYFPNAVDGDIMAAEKAAYLAFTSLAYDLRANNGIEVALYDGYRTAKDQEFLNEIFDREATGLHRPGFSEHHTGLVLDLVIWYSEDGESYEWYSPTAERIANFPEFQTVYDKMVDYGFIMRYPDEKADITGVKDQEYEIRFVGSAEVAHAITDNALCLEEYLAK